MLKDVSFVLPGDRNIGILGANGAGKSTLLRLLGGMDMPNKGKVIRHSRVSWPLALSGGFQGSMTGVKIPVSSVVSMGYTTLTRSRSG